MDWVSVIMPCYNDGAYLSESVASVWAQTYPQVELILIDDGSDDKLTQETIAQIKHDNLTVLHTDHVGPSVARNMGIENAKGKYILPLDADDLIEPTYIEKAVQVLEQQANVGIVYCQADLFGVKTGPWVLPPFSIPRMLCENVIFVTSLFRKADWELVGGFYEGCTDGFEDYDFWLSLIEKGYTALQLPETLFHYRIKQHSRTSNVEADDQKRLDAYRLITKRHLSLYESNVEQVVATYRELINHFAHVPSGGKLYSICAAITSTIKKLFRKSN